MTKHRLHYIDMRPAPLKREPSTLAIWLGAAFTVAALYLLTVILFFLFKRFINSHWRKLSTPPNVIDLIVTQWLTDPR